MIKDSLSNANLYYGISNSLKKGFEWLINNDMEAVAPGKYIIDGNKIYANIQEYLTKSDAKYEAHRKYIDIQYMIKGIEKVGVSNIKNCETFEEYNEEKDLEFLLCNQKEEWQTLNTGDFLVFFPTDAHKPSINYETQQNVKKVVVKVAVD